MAFAKFSSVDERVLNTIARLAKGPVLTRSRLRYSLPDVPAEQLDGILQKYHIGKAKTPTGATTYSVLDALVALKQMKEQDSGKQSE